MTAADLQQYVDSHTETDVPFLESAWDTATALVDKYIGDAGVPDGVRFACKLEVGAQLFNRRSAPGGVTQFAVFGGDSAVRISGDPLSGVYPLLRPWMGPVIA